MEPNQGNETQTTSSTENTATESADNSAGTASPNTSGASSAAASPADAGAATAPEGVPAYNPNYKFKVLDKELEFDPELKGVIKDQNTEKKFRELYEKAYGLDHIKGERQKLREEFTGFKEKAAQRDKAIETLNGFLQKGDIHSFCQALKIPEQTMIQYALERINYREMSPEQRAQVDEQFANRHRTMSLEEQNQMLTQRIQAESARARTVELDSELARPEVQAAAQAFDARVGQPGAFKQEIINTGMLYWHRDQVDLPASKAIQEVMRRLGLSSAQQNANPNLMPNFDTAGAGQATVQTQTQQQKPVIPNIRGSGASPVRKVPRSIEDLKNLAKQKSAGQ